MLQGLLNAITFGATGRPGDIGPVNLSSPYAAEIFGSSRAGSGVSVNAESALTCSSWFRAIDLLSDSIAKTPAYVYRNLPDNGGKEADRKHAWFRAVNRKPGPNWTAFQFFKPIVSWLRSNGNAYAYIDRENFELIPVHPCRVTPVIEGAGKLWYVLDNSRKYNPDEFLHFKGFGYDGLIGYSVIDKAKESIGLSMGARLHQAKTLGNSARPSVLLTTPNKMQKAARDTLLNEWQAMHGGGGNAGRTAILDNGLKAEPYAFSSQDMELMKTQEFSVRDIANFAGVPPHKLGDQSRGGYNSLEQENLSFLGDTLEAILVNLEQELEDKLLTEDEKAAGSHEIQFDRAALSATDTNTKATYWRTALGGHPWAEIAEARRAFGLNHVEGTDKIPEPANMQGGGEANRPKDATGEFPSGLHETAVAALNESVRRIIRRLGNQAKAKAGKPAEFLAWVDSLQKDNTGAVCTELETHIALANGIGGLETSAVQVGCFILAEAEKAFAAVAETVSAKELPGAVHDACIHLINRTFAFPTFTLEGQV